MTQLLEIENLSIAFHHSRGSVQALNRVSLSIGRKETVCLVGESGSGKTVTSKAVMRLIDYEHGQVTAGSIRLDGVELTALSQQELRSLRGKRIAMVFQEPMSAFDPIYTIGHQIVETILQHERLTRKSAWERGTRLLERVGIPEPALRMKQYPGELSGGMLQRAMIAMALSCSPELLIADEPTTALDVTIQSQILNLLQELKEEFNMSILLITHDLGVAAELADRVVVMYAGQVVEQAGAAELFARPYHPYTQGLLRSVASLDAAHGEGLYSIEGAIPSLGALPGGCLFHPRCPYATEQCRMEEPPLTNIEGREAACWHMDSVIGLADRGLPPNMTTPAELPGNMPASAVPASLEAATIEKSPPVGSPVMSELEAVAVEAATTDTESRPAKLAGRSDAIAAGTTIPPSGQTPQQVLFEVKGLRKYYPVNRGWTGRPRTLIRAVDDVSFTLRAGETLGLVGESGSGKSTLGRVLLQLERATSGEVWFGGRELTRLGVGELRPIRRELQMIFQDPYGSLDPRWRVGDIIGEPLALHEGLAGKDKLQRVAELLSAVGLDSSYASRYPHEFSGGQRQRIAIARAIALNPRFILADEAVSALDVSVQAQIVKLLQSLQQQLGLTYLFIAHGLQVVRYISDRIGVMYLGQLVEMAPSEELFLHPAHPYTRALIASIPQPDPSRRRQPLAMHGELPSPARPPSGCRFHPRCPLATAKCREEQPQLQPISTERFVACHYPL